MNKDASSCCFVVDVQNYKLFHRSFHLPDVALIKRWVFSVFKHEEVSAAELTLRFVDEKEMQELNSRYRGKHRPTNVLSFPANIMSEVEFDLPLLGDVVLCVPVIEQEAQDQHTLPVAHWAHLVIHGTLHLLGYDHEQNEDAKIMEDKEVILLNQWGFSNPYEEMEVL